MRFIKLPASDDLASRRFQTATDERDTSIDHL